MLHFVTFGIKAQTDQKVPSINAFIKEGTVQYKGMFNIYVQNEKYYMEIPDALFERDILANITINGGSAQVDRDTKKRFGFSGDAVYDVVFHFSKYGSKKVFIEQPVFYYNVPDSANSYYRMLKDKLVPVGMSFEVVAAGAGSLLFDITDSFNSDLSIFSLSGAKEELGLGSYQSALSYPIGVKCYKDNIIFRSVRAYGPGSNTAPAKMGLSSPVATKTEENKGPSGPTVWEIGACWCLLPEIPMTPRVADKRVGFFTKPVKDYGVNPNQIEDLALATRWRIAPKTADLEKYRNGEMVEPEKPIVFYIDKNTPEYLKPYFIAGVNVWQKAFEKIGFKNAIIARPEPTAAEDPDFAIDNIKYSIISYKPSLTPNAYGPSIVDPRSGEILNSHLAVFHNITDLLQRWYFIMCAAADPRAQKLPFAPEVMGPLVQTVITHEVGHTLGLRHNFAGSSTYETDSIRNNAFITKNGYGASIMDYMRFNYLAQPEDKLLSDQLLPRIGVYDNYAIEWGYKYFPQFTEPFKESEYLRSWVSEKRKDPRLFYLEETDNRDPRVQAEDLGENSMKSSRLGIKNLKLLMRNLDKWLDKDDDENYTMLRKMHTAIVSRYNEYLGHVLKNIGGRYGDEALVVEHKPGYVPVNRTKQMEAMAFMKTYFFEEPAWLFPDRITFKTKFFFEGQVLEDYETFLGKILFKISFIANDERLMGNDPYTVKEFLDDLYDDLFLNVEDKKNMSPYQRILQRTYVNNILKIVNNPSSYDSDIAVLVALQIEKIAQTCTKAARENDDQLSKEHLNAISGIIRQWTNSRDNITLQKN